MLKKTTSSGKAEAEVEAQVKKARSLLIRVLSAWVRMVGRDHDSSCLGRNQLTDEMERPPSADYS
jgi:hypothetical protein